MLNSEDSGFVDKPYDDCLIFKYLPLVAGGGTEGNR
jgi:hypothetical protein